MFGEPKEDIFYTLFKEFGAKIVETAEEYSTILDGYPETGARIPQMKVYERECDEKVQRIMKELYTSFVTPFEREDISDLALGLDDIVDGMNSMLMSSAKKARSLPSSLSVHALRSKRCWTIWLTIRKTLS